LTKARKGLGLLIVLSLQFAACGKSAIDKQPSRSNPDVGNSPNALLEDALKSYKESSEPPDGWPSAFIPIPPGSKVVSYLAGVTVPGTPGEGTAVLYSAPESPEAIQAFWARELPKRGWTILDAPSPGVYLLTSAEGNGYVGLFGSGQGLGPTTSQNGVKISMQVILAKKI
jgi:hypothetical protein